MDASESVTHKVMILIRHQVNVMRIQKKRVRNLQINLPGIQTGAELLIVIPIAGKIGK
jgi:hypothetical protein